MNDDPANKGQPVKPLLVKRIDELHRYLGPLEGRTIGLVPTMGALHLGHAALIERARNDCERVVVTVFVNPLQFGPKEDLATYPRQLEADLVVAGRAGADIVFAPANREIYPEQPLTTVKVDDLDQPLCGGARPDHFAGVATVVAKLFNIVKPQKAYFGAKDRQQLLIVRRMTRDLNFPIEIVAVATVRDSDGLAISSRNRYLSAAERRAALALPRALMRAKNMIEAGEIEVNKISRAAKEVIAAESDLKLEYLSICRADDLSPLDKVRGEVLIAAAIHIGKTRLIDNLVVAV
jgi:pantoate--beta-alanine ligase